MATSVTIIGGGISGITTALTLQLLGYDTTCYAEHFVSDKTPDDPRFASLYPAASVIPHSVVSKKTGSLLKNSLLIFDVLHNRYIPSLVQHQHYELFEFPVDDPSYASSLTNFKRIENSNNPDSEIPKRPGASSRYGWKFNCYVTEWPDYITSLYDFYRQAGGSLIQKKLTGNSIAKLPDEIIINCAGFWGCKLFNDPEPLRVVRGHLIHISDAPLLKMSDGTIPSYNYTPGKSVYANPDGSATDVYFYPRSNGWIIGGSRQKAVVNENERWTQAGSDDTITINGIELPRQVYELNREIIRETYGTDIDKFSSLHPKIGYRYVRKFEGDGLRLDTSEEYGKTIFHNYGHGGAGVTLSWGCAVDISREIKSQFSSGQNNLPSVKDNTVLNEVQDVLQKLVSG